MCVVTHYLHTINYMFHPSLSSHVSAIKYSVYRYLEINRQERLDLCVPRNIPHCEGIRLTRSYRLQISGRRLDYISRNGIVTMRLGHCRLSGKRARSFLLWIFSPFPRAGEMSSVARARAPSAPCFREIMRPAVSQRAR